MHVFTIPASEWDERAPDKETIRHLIMKHQQSVPRLRKLKEYYEGLHKILKEEDRENPLVCNHAKDIADTSSSYFIGEPVSYKAANMDIKTLTDALGDAGADEVDGDNGLDLAIYGRAYEYIYTKKNDTALCTKTLEPENTFIVYDDTIEQNELFGVYYYPKVDSRDVNKTIYMATILTENYKYSMEILDADGPQELVELPEPHFKGEVPIIEYYNNKLQIGDFELQIPLIDAYNALMSDRITDKEQFIDAILALYGTLLADDEEETQDGDTPMKKLKKERLLELPEGSKAEYLTNTFDENGVEILKKAIEQDIHKFSNIPCMTDESFGGNVSGVAMEFKLLGMENITKIKSRYYKKGLRKRIRIFCNFLNLSGSHIEAKGITFIFSRALPKNLLEISQIIANLWGKVSRKTLLSQIPFVEDPEEELRMLDQEEEENMRRQQELFGHANTQPDDYEDEEEEVILNEQE